MIDRKDKYIVDRIEDNGVVVCEYNGEIFNLDISLCPENVKPGDVLVFGDDSFIYDGDTTSVLKNKISLKSKKIFK